MKKIIDFFEIVGVLALAIFVLVLGLCLVTQTILFAIGLFGGVFRLVASVLCSAISLVLMLKLLYFAKSRK